MAPAERLRYSALLAGVAITPFALGSAAAAALGGRIVNRYGRPLVALGLALVAAGLAGTVLALDLVPGPDGGWAARCRCWSRGSAAAW